MKLQEQLDTRGPSRWLALSLTVFPSALKLSFFARSGHAHDTCNGMASPLISLPLDHQL